VNLRGKVWKFGADVDTDVILPSRYLNMSDPAELAKHCMEDADPAFAAMVRPGDIMVAGKNFGCGSSREHAPIAIKAAGVSCVIAHTFARIFYRSAFNIGLPILEAPDAVEGINAGDEVMVEADTGAITITNCTTGGLYRAAPVPPFMQQIIEAGGLIPYVVAKVRAK
jgi:3-isopropylmalate dehydratase small subunit